jgi:hypothetical protein
MIRLSYELMSATLPNLQIKTVLSFLQAHSITLLEFLTSVLQSTDRDARRSADVILQNSQVILEIIGSHPISQSAAQQWAKGVTIEVCREQILELTKKENGLHFTAINTTEKQIQQFSMSSLMQKLESMAPDMWQILGVLFAADPRSNYQRSWTEKKRQKKKKERKKNRAADGDIEMQDIQVGDLDDETEDSDAEYWAGTGMQTLIPEEEDEPEDILDQVEEQQRRLVAMVSIDFHLYDEE